MHRALAFHFTFYFLSSARKEQNWNKWGDLSGGPIVKTLRFHYRGHRFDPWLGH